MDNQLQPYQQQSVVIQQHQSIFFNIKAFEDGQRMATLLAKSKLIPANFQENLPDCLIALELAMRIGASPMAVMQNTYIVHGRPGYSAQFVIAMINSCGRYSPLRFELTGDGDSRECYAWAYELASGDKLTGTPVSIKMAKAEGWYSKTGSKWQTMPELMLRYRAAAFFGRMYAPELLMGIKTAEELYDIDERTPQQNRQTPAGNSDLNARFASSGPVIDVEHETISGPAKEEVTTATPETQKPQEEPPKERKKAAPKKEAPPATTEPVEPEIKQPAKNSQETTITNLVAALDAMTKWPDVLAWGKSIDVVKQLSSLNDEQRGKILAYSNLILHRLQVSEIDTVGGVNEWADLKMNGVKVQFENECPSEAGRYFGYLQRHCIDRINLLKEEQGEPRIHIPEHSSGPTENNQMADINRSKEFNRFIDQINSKETSLTLNTWAMATINSRLQLAEEEQNLLSELLVSRLADLEMGESGQ